MLPGEIIVIVDVGFVEPEDTAEMSQWLCHCTGGRFEEIRSI